MVYSLRRCSSRRGDIPTGNCSERLYCERFSFGNLLFQVVYVFQKVIFTLRKLFTPIGIIPKKLCFTIQNLRIKVFWNNAIFNIFSSKKPFLAITFETFNWNRCFSYVDIITKEQTCMDIWSKGMKQDRTLNSLLQHWPRSSLFPL